MSDTSVITGIPAPTPFLQNPGEPSIPWGIWSMTFDNYLNAIGLDVTKNADRCRALLIACLGTEGQRILYTFDQAKLKTLQEVKDTLKKYFGKVTSKWSERVKFSERKQRNLESIESYISDLRQMAAKCHFDSVKDPLKEALLGQFIVGIRNHRVREKLLLEDDSKLDFDKAVEIAKEYERVSLDSDIFSKSQAQSEDRQVYVVHKSRQKNTDERKNTNIKTRCFRCGDERHLASSQNCPARQKKCRICQKFGHLAVCCRNRQDRSSSRSYRSNSQRGYRQQDGNRRSVHEVGESNDEIDEIHSLFSDTICKVSQKVTVQFEVDGNKKVLGLIDTGAYSNVMPFHVVQKIGKEERIKACPIKLSTFSGEPIKVKGSIVLKCKATENREFQELEFIVTEIGSSVLLGLDAIRRTCFIQEALKEAISDKATSGRQGTQGTVNTAEKTGIGCIKGVVHKVRINTEVTPVRQKLRQIPFALRDKVSAEVKRLLENDIIEKVSEPSEWVSNVVVVTKPSGKIRLCIDLRMPNKAVITDGYAIPRIEELLHTMKGCGVFSKIDLSEAYLQLRLHKDSRELTTFITHDGLFRFKRCPFGLASCPSAFQSVMTTLLKGIPGVVCYLDDILISAASQELHDERLAMVMKKLHDSGVVYNKDKCTFSVSKISYLGHEVSRAGIKPSPDKMKALLEAVAPKTIPELKTVLGAFGYYARFIPNFATMVEPLRNLLSKDKFDWTDQAQEAYEKLKVAFCESSALAPFDNELPVVVSTDASNVGLGATLSIRDPILGLRTVEFASRRLRKEEVNYSTTEKESLAIVWACEKWRPYLVGRVFTLETDHEPLKMIFSTKGIDRMSLRIARWAIRLMAFSFEVRYKKGSENRIPDFCSRFPKMEKVNEANQEEEKTEEFINSVTGDRDLTARLNEESEECSEISEICKFVTSGWPKKTELKETSKKYYQVRDELTVHKNKLLRKDRIVVPRTMRSEILQRAHQCHMGIQKTKLRLRMAYWWPGMTKEAEELVRNCCACAQASKSLKMGPGPSKESLPRPSMAWERVAIDIKGPMYQLPATERYALVMVDLHSKWPEVQFTSSTETYKIIKFLTSVFAREGYPNELLSDNGVQFCSREFTEFLRGKDIKHIKTPLYNPESNSVVERFNKTLGEQVEMARIEKVDIRKNVHQFLHIYRSTPHSTTGCSPSLLIHGREMRTQLIPRKEEKIKKKVRFEEDQVPFPVGTRVCIKHPRTGRISWNRTVTKVIGTKSVLLDNGQKWHVSKVAKDRSRRGELDLGELPDWRRSVGSSENGGSESDRTVTEDREQNRRAGDSHDNATRESRRRKTTRDADFVYY